MDSKVKEQILAIRNTGLTNMFDTRAVQRIAHEMNFFELVVFLRNIKINTSASSSRAKNSTVSHTIFYGSNSLKNSSSLCSDLPHN